MLNVKNMWRLSTRLIFLLFLFAGCEKPNAPVEIDIELDGIEKYSQTSAALTAIHNLKSKVRSSLATGSPLSLMAEKLDQIAIERSSAIKDAQSARAELDALRYQRFPRLLPTAEVSLTGGRETSIGLSLEQNIWDGGRLKAQLHKVNLKVEESIVRAWRERNEVIYEGLMAYVELSKNSAHLDKLKWLLRDLKKLQTRLVARLNGGVSDRGEVLRITTEIQKTERQIVASRVKLRQEKSKLQRIHNEFQNLEPIVNLNLAARSCLRDWPQVEAPDVFLSRIAFERTKALELETRAKRLPRLVLGLGAGHTGSIWTGPVSTFRLDATDMLGLERNSTIEAAISASEAAESAYAEETRDIQILLEDLDFEYTGLASDAVALRALIRESEAIVDLFEKQFEVGSISLTEGIIFHRELTNTRIALIDVETRVLMNCLQASKTRGLLISSGVIDGQY